MPAKMINEIPLPMPRSEICSPSHMMNTVPVVSVSTVMQEKPSPGRGHERPPALCPLEERRCHRDWMSRGPGVQVAGLLVIFLRPSSPSFYSFSRVRHKDRQQLQNDRSGDVGHDAQGEVTGGSSSMSSEGWRTSAQAKPNFCFMPPESRPARRLEKGASPAIRINSA